MNFKTDGSGKRSVRRRQWREHSGSIFDEPFDSQRLAGHVAKFGSRIARAHQRSYNRGVSYEVNVRRAGTYVQRQLQGCVPSSDSQRGVLEYYVEQKNDIHQRRIAIK